MLEKYYKYKLDYRDYIVLIKCGSFYKCIDNDAFIMNRLFNYKLKPSSKTFKVGFPINSLINIINILNSNNINYIVVDNEITQIKEFENNNYLDYKFDDKKIYFNLLKSEQIYKYLVNNVIEKDFTKKILEIERILYD